MQKRRTIGVSLDKNVLSRIDSIRELAPRSRFIEKLVLDSLGTAKQNE